jgi:hypothetical protein
MKIVLFILALLVAIQFIKPAKTNPPVDETIALHAPKEVMKVLKDSCYDCHSNETKWPLYSEVAPFSWSIISHVNEGREALNFSNWKNIDQETKTKRLKRAIKTVNNGMMPLSSYLMLHKEAHLNDAQKATLIEWCNRELAK